MFDLGIHSIWGHHRVEPDHPLLTVIFRCGCWMEFFQYPQRGKRETWTPVYTRQQHPASGPGSTPDCRAHLLVSVMRETVWEIKHERRP